ncbi:MAG TPA: hypothetical protein PLJ26_01020 [Candidatus Omnitrophota bacterium]|mgnify:CR=1 FL=1|nr:hypothetical protein [Candidatus Omnitrophota bacterium]HQJ15056.1 hypothetical protein [Candidatus Omnitrophota bacterium]
MLDSQDRLILAHLQDGFPLDPRPYAAIARRLHIPVSCIKARAALFLKKGIIRYIGAVIDTKKAGFMSSLAALAIPRSRVNAAGNIINEYPQVTHNYLRDDEYNMWFTVSCRTVGSRAELVRRICKETGASKCLDLPTVKVFKIDARFPLMDRAPGTFSMRRSRTRLFHRAAIPLCRKYLPTLAMPLDVTDRPFLPIARALECTEQDVTGLIARALEKKLIRRFGAVLDHYKIGLKTNALVAWQVDQVDVARAASVMARVPHVSHCYLRTVQPGWPYSLYTMIHAVDRPACRKILNLILRQLGPIIKGMKILFTVKELKKTRFETQQLGSQRCGREKKIQAGFRKAAGHL